MEGARRLDWQYRGEYIRTRSVRRVGDTDIDPAWADEAFTDDDALVDSPDPASKSGQTDRLVGYSPSARMVIVVIYLREGLIGVNAWRANPTQTRHYWEEEDRANRMGERHMEKQADIEQLIAEEVEASERTRDAPVSGRAVRKRPTRSVVYSIRLTPEQTEEIQQLADTAGIPAAGLVRGWVLQGLAAEREGSVEQTVEALSRDVDRLRRQLGEREAS